MEMELSNGLTEQNTTANGKITKWTELASLGGQMEEFM